MNIPLILFFFCGCGGFSWHEGVIAAYKHIRE